MAKRGEERRKPAPPDLVEQVAQALFMARAERIPESLKNREMGDFERIIYTRQARAAMRVLGYDT